MISWGALDRGLKSGWRGWCGSVQGGLALALLTFALYLPGFFAMPVVDRDEARFAQASRQMVESGNVVVPMVLGRPRLNKPPLVYWAQSAVVWCLAAGDARRDAAWMYRVPSLLAGIGSVLLTWRLGRRLFDARAAWLAGLLLAACPIMFWEAHQARADMLLVLWTTLSMWWLWETLHASRHGSSTLKPALVLWAAVGLGVMTKGPITPALVAMAVLGVCMLERSWRALRAIRPVMGLAIVVALALPWVVLVGRSVGWETYAGTIYDEVLGRSLEAKEGHDGPPLFHAALATVLFWPGSLLLWYGLARGVRVGLVGEPGGGAATGAGRLARARRWLRTRVAGRPQEVFLLAWLVPGWWMFEVVSTKLPHYTMPLYPALALLCARGGLSGAEWLREAGQRRVIRTLGGAWSLAGLGLCAVMATLAWLAVRGPGQAPVIAGGGIVGASFGLAAWFHVKCQRRLRAGVVRGMLPLGLGVLVATASVIGWSIPNIQDVWISRRAVEALRRIDPGQTRPFASSVFVEDSLVFESRGRVECVELYELDGWIAAHPTGVMLIPASFAVTRGWRTLASVEGFNYTKGSKVDLVLCEGVTR